MSPRIHALFLSALSMMTLTVAGCGGGGGDSEADPCTTLKIAGGTGCAASPKAIALVASDKGYCTGTFITNKHVLTAAHCIPSSSSRIVVGARGFSSDAAHVDVHPGYDGDVSSPFDVAVVTLLNSAAVDPVPLEISRAVSPGDRVIAYGFGLDEAGDDVIERVDNGGLALKATDLEVTQVNSGTIYTKSDGNGDTCQGDSGGALLTPGDDGRPAVVALVRSGPDTCVVNSGYDSENTNIQGSSVLEFILAKAPGAQVD